MTTLNIFATHIPGDIDAEQLDDNFQTLLDLIMGDLELTNASVETSTLGNTTVIAAVPAKRISVHKAFLLLASQTTIAFKSGSGTTLVGPVTCTGLEWLSDSNAYAITAVGEALTMVLGAGVLCGGMIGYKLID